MHEMGIVQNVLSCAGETARRAGAVRVTRVGLRIGEMCEVVPEALEFAWEALSETDPMCAGARLTFEEVGCASVCEDCGLEFEHDRFHCRCPRCGGGRVRLVRGRELDIVSIDVETPGADGAPAKKEDR